MFDTICDNSNLEEEARVSFNDDMQKGRDIYRKRYGNRTQPKRTAPNNGSKIAIGLGTIMEQLFPSKKKDDPVTRISNPSKVEPYLDVVKGDIKNLMDRLCSVLPKKKEKYDPLLEAWKRNRNM
jgi:hypothetical protein